LSLNITLLLTSYIITQSIGQRADRFHDIRILVETGEIPAMKRCWSGRVDHATRTTGRWWKPPATRR
jgi:hypothetical protein